MRSRLWLRVCVPTMLILAACSSNSPPSAPEGKDVGPSSIDAGTDAGIDAGTDAGTCTLPCGSTFCCQDDGFICVDGACCKPSCTDKECGSDGCGGSCGECNPGWTCNSKDTCECTGESDDELCTAEGKVCGTLVTLDKCGDPRTVDCDSCVAPETCDMAAGQCRCVRETVQQFCQAQGHTCGSTTGLDHCGNSWTVDCGGCDAGKSCVDGACVCTAETKAQFCARLHKTCGSVTDLDTCGQSRTEDCGGCTAPSSCVGGACVCAPETDTALCTAAGRACGSLSMNDRCNNARTITSCGTCSVGFCDPNGQCVNCLPETDADFCTRLTKTCGSVTAADNCGTTRTVADCGTCTAPQACEVATNVCGTTGTASNDDCAGAALIPFVQTNPTTQTGTLQVDTSLATNSGDAACNGASGKDEVFYFTLTSPMDFVAVSTPTTGSAAEPNLYLRAAGNCSAQPEIACARVSSVTLVQIDAEALAPGTYYLWVDGWAASSGNGPQTVVVTLSTPPASPGNDLCVSADALNFVGNVATASGTTRGAVDDGTGSCGTMTGGDVYYVMTLPYDSSVTAKVTRSATSASMAPAVWITTACSSGTQVACGTSTTDTVLAGSLNLTAGVYYVVVDSTNTKRGDFTLEVTTGPAITNDSCTTGALAVTIDPVSGTGSISSDTTAATDDATAGCKSSSTGKDLVFSFEVPAGRNRNATITATPATGSPINPVVSVRTTCDQSSSEVACSANATAGAHAVNARNLTPGVYYVWVDGYSSTANGPFTLAIELSDPPPAPPNDLCAAAEVVTLDRVTLTASVPGTTVSATNDGTGTCGAMSSGDVVFSVNLATASSLLAIVSRDAGSPDFLPAVYIRPEASCTSAASADQKACGIESGGNTPGTAGIASATASNLPAGNYSVIVDGMNGTEGAFILDLRAGPPITNDTCSTPMAITVDPTTGIGTVWGDTRGLANDNTNSSSCTSTPANDVMYSITLPRRQNLKVDINPLNGSKARHTLMVRTDCNNTTTNEKGCKAATAAGLPASLLVSGLPAATYYILVDGWLSYDNGPYSLTVTATDPVPPPNDSCATATPLTLDLTTGIATAAGTTIDAASDGSGSCRTATTDPTGGDVVYAFTTTAENRIQVDVAPTTGSTLRPVVFLRRNDCAAATAEVTCFAGASTTSTASVIVPFAAAGTYYVWVDSYSPNEVGTFNLTVTATAPPAPPSEDTCRGTPLALTWDSTTSKFTGTGSTSMARDDYAGICSTTASPHSGGDVVFSFTTASAYKATVKITPDSSSPTYKPAFYIRTVCESVVPDENLGCASATSTGTFTATVPYVPAGTNYLIVDGVSGTFGGFTVEITTAAPVAGDSCLTAIPITIVPGTQLQVTGSTTDAVNDATSLGCGGTDLGRDLVYTFSTVGQGDQLFTASLNFASSGYAAMGLRRALCATSNVADEAACARRTTYGVGLTMTTRLSEGVYYLWVDDTSTSYYGNFTLNLDLTPVQPPPLNDQCGRADNLGDLTTAQSVTRSGSTSWATNDYGPANCGTTTSTSGDAVYSFTLTADTQIQAVAARTTGNTTYKPTVYIRKTNCTDATAASHIACASSDTGTATVKSYVLTPGTYFVFVDAQSGGDGDYTLTVTSSAPRYYPDNCASAKALQFDANGHATMRDDTTDAALDAAPPNCITVGGTVTQVSGPDLVYVVDTTGKGVRDFVASVQFDGASVYPQLYLRTVCGSATATDQLGCVQRYTGGPPPLTLGIAGLPEGVYYLWVDVNYATDKGPFNLTVDLLQPPPAVPPNDTCATPTTLVFDTTGYVSVNGSTGGGTNDTTGSCGTMTGSDVVYSFRLPSTANVQVTATRSFLSPNFEPAVHIRSSCASTGATDEKACAVHASGVATATANNLSGGTYYVVVDGTNGTSGQFTLTAMVVSLATNDCAQLPMLYPDPVTGSVTLRADTASGTSRTTNSCNNYDGAKDIGFAFEVPAGRPKDVTVVLNPVTGSAYRPSVSIRSSCTGTEATDKPTEVTNSCGYLSTSGPMTVLVPNMQPGVYYLFVDSYASSTTTNYPGPFTMTLTLVDPPPPPTNDTCAGATDLTFVSGVAQVNGAILYNATNDTSGTCAAMSGPDVVYRFTARQDQKAVVTLQGHGKYAPSFYLRTDCASAAKADQLLCSTTTTTAGTVTGTRYALAAGTYYLWVDSGASNFIGTFDLKVELSAPYLPCVSAVPLTLSVGVNGDTTSAPNAFNEANACSTAGYAGHDVVYSYTPTTSGSFKATAYAQGTSVDVSWDGVIWIASACDPNNCVARGDDPETVSYTHAVAGTTYYIILDGFSATAMGPYTMMVEPGPPPPDCTAAVVLQYNVGYDGDTTNTPNTWGANSCSTSGVLGHDQVFAFTPTANGSFTATAYNQGTTTVLTTFDGVVWIADSCDPDTCLGRADEPESVTVANGVAGHTYYIILDGYFATAMGTYTMLIH